MNKKDKIIKELKEKIIDLETNLKINKEELNKKIEEIDEVKEENEKNKFT